MRMTPVFLTMGCLLFLPCVQTGGSCAEKGKDTVRIRQLPAPEKTGRMSVEEAITLRRSVRSFSNSQLTEKELSQLLFAAQGITDAAGGLRASPSAGATFPLEVYCVTADGVFKYHPKQHSLETIKSGDFRSALAEAALGQECVKSAPVNIVFSAVASRTTKRYGERGNRYVLMEAGHAAENVHLQAVALGLCSVPIGAFDDRQAGSVIGTPDSEAVLYIIPVGRKK